MSSARAAKTGRRRKPAAKSLAAQPYFEGSAFGPRDAAAGAKVHDWIRKNPASAVKLARKHAAAFDKSHSVAGATKRSASKKPTR